MAMKKTMILMVILKLRLSMVVLFVPVTIIETPPIFVFAFRVYVNDSITKTRRVLTQIWGKNTSKDLNRRIKLPKDDQDQDHKIADVRKIIDEVQEIRVLVHTLPKEAGLSQKSPDILEIKVGGPIPRALDYALKQLGKQIDFNAVYKPTDLVDVTTTTKGKGFAGPVKRHGIKILPRKTRKGRRVVGCIGPWHPARVMWTVPRAGQLGYFARTEHNKMILKIGDDGEEVTPVNGFKRYGKVGSHCVIHGSLPGSVKRLVRLRDPIRAKPTDIEDIQITYISTSAKN